MNRYEIHEYVGLGFTPVIADNWRYQRKDRNCNVVEFYKTTTNGVEIVAVMNLRESWFRKVDVE